MRIVVLSPHRDDAALALGLTVGAWLEQGHAVEVMNVFTRTEHAPYSDSGSLHANDRASFASAVRKREDESWVKLYAGHPGKGRVALSDLNLKDAPLRLHIRPDEVLHREPLLTEKIVLKVKRALEQSRAAVLVLPLGVGGHVDHLTTRQLALPADIAAMPVAFYEDQPYAAQQPELVEAAVQGSALAAGAPLEAVFAADATDVEAAFLRKRKIALCYDSQYDDATAETIARFSEQYGGRERLWANAAWRATTFTR
jgi:LmbE family N-acetylglucosaminyl deacetylase